MADTKEAAAEKRSAALSDRDAQSVEALKVERNGYVVRGLSERVAQVDAELAKFGVKVEPARKVKADD